MPERVYNRGKAPGLTTKELFTRMNTNAKILDEGGKIVTKWTVICTMVTDKEKSELMGKVIEITVRTVMKKHMFMFDGKAYLQSEGGAIGLRLMGVVARIIMDRWSGTMKRRMMLNKMEYFLMIKYVDDVYVFL